MNPSRRQFLPGIVLTGLFLWLAFRQVHFHELGISFAKVTWGWLLPGVLTVMLGHYLRAVRWGFLIGPLQRVPTGPLFSSLLVGYMGNMLLPAHLGEFIRAYLLGQRRRLSPGSVLASIVVERLLDVATLVLLLGLSLLVFPFPSWVRNSGLVVLAGVVGLGLLLAAGKRHPGPTSRWLTGAVRVLPPAARGKVVAAVVSFLAGLQPLRRRRDYLWTVLLSASIWASYAAVFWLVFRAFGYQRLYGLSWLAALVLLVVTTISVLVPSSPGYIGTYHYLCQVALGFFAVPRAQALSYAILVHALNFFPILLAGALVLLLGSGGFASMRQAGRTIAAGASGTGR
ncbi:MAG TPA: lysylphosphatidylglycerol synthase transmembrane domain-containing protein [Candidatus Aminicenantes bacterium]|nr:lysylphosphatidylglycerol synthase transmembrane domain-containing protein [Candidatus Aminicenantes bacterium]